MDWKFLEEVHYNPVSWGWTLQNGLYHPIFSDQPPAPDDLLKFVRCKCKLTSKNPCSTNCSCKKNGLYCVLACGDCRGDGCQNEDPNKNDMVNICDDIDDRNIFDLFK